MVNQRLSAEMGDIPYMVLIHYVSIGLGRTQIKKRIISSADVSFDAAALLSIAYELK
jgi:hypothetical protein